MASTRTNNQVVKLTKTVVDRIPVPVRGQAFVRDAELKGFGVRVTAGGVKSYILEKRVEGKVRRQTICRVGELTCENARKQALILLGQIAKGENPIADRERSRLELITLGHAFEDYKRARKDLKPKTLYEYELLLKSCFGDWAKRPLVKITKDKVARRHRELGEGRGKAVANHSMRFLRALLNFSMYQYEDGFGRSLLLENPVRRLNQTRAWYRDTKRTRYIKPHELQAWHKAVEALRDEETPLADTVADYLLFMLFTGLRRGEAGQLTWEQVDLKDRSVLFPDPKNREPFVLPLSDYLVELLERRQTTTANAYVFPGTGRRGYVVEPKRQVQKVIKTSKVPFSPHDLRRTFVTTAESLNLSPYTIKRLVNHKLSNDITARYIGSDVDRLREPMQVVTNRLLDQIAGKVDDKVISIDKARTRRRKNSASNIVAP